MSDYNVQKDKCSDFPALHIQLREVGLTVKNKPSGVSEKSALKAQRWRAIYGRLLQTRAAATRKARTIGQVSNTTWRCNYILINRLNWFIHILQNAEINAHLMRPKSWISSQGAFVYFLIWYLSFESAELRDDAFVQMKVADCVTVPWAPASHAYRDVRGNLRGAILCNYF